MAEAVVAGALVTIAGETAIPIIMKHMTFAQRRSAQTNILVAQKLIHEYQNLYEADELGAINEELELLVFVPRILFRSWTNCTFTSAKQAGQRLQRTQPGIWRIVSRAKMAHQYRKYSKSALNLAQVCRAS